eukprot:Lithocolla_globosa_v1_NODE_128_length_6012_cov_35.307202.p4 type:complete len:154 gc:universal NODE_128_length_6012_cov_35.307202:1032-1493(+)
MPNISFSSASDIEVVLAGAPGVPWCTKNLKPEFPRYLGDTEVTFKHGFDVFKEMFRDPYWNGRLVTNFELCEVNGARLYGPLNSGLWWEFTQSKLPVGSELFPFAIASDSTQIVKKGNKCFWPIYLIFRSVTDSGGKTDRAIQLIGHIPIAKR